MKTGIKRQGKDREKKGERVIKVGLRRIRVEKGAYGFRVARRKKGEDRETGRRHR